MWTNVFIRRRRCVGPGVFDGLIGRHESTTLQLQCCFLYVSCKTTGRYSSKPTLSMVLLKILHLHLVCELQRHLQLDYLLHMGGHKKDPSLTLHFELKKANVSLEAGLIFWLQQTENVCGETIGPCFYCQSSILRSSSSCLHLVPPHRSTAESLSNQSEAELQRRLEDRQQEICHMQEILETKVQLLQEVKTQTRSSCSQQNKTQLVL